MGIGICKSKQEEVERIKLSLIYPPYPLAPSLTFMPLFDTQAQKNKKMTSRSMLVSGLLLASQAAAQPIAILELNGAGEQKPISSPRPTKITHCW